ncbi:hypothetical protein LZZ98_12950 [Acinetobacter sp. SM34]|nr:hypothetical protein [Acinetobacter sp. SM34]MCG2609416.1 hypothetical protein [Acinetobacter sp. SM34]
MSIFTPSLRFIPVSVARGEKYLNLMGGLLYFRAMRHVKQTYWHNS